MQLGTAGKKFGSAVILAGGKSKRMGFDKKFLEINGARLAERLAVTLETDFDEIIFVSNPPVTLVSGFTTISDEIAGAGPLGGIHAGLKHASSEYVYVIACDMPIVNLEYIRFMKDTIKNRDVDACAAKAGERIEPFNAFYSTRIVKEMEDGLQNGNSSVFRLLERLRCHFIEEETVRKFSPDWSMFINLNTKDELTKYADSV